MTDNKVITYSLLMIAVWMCYDIARDILEKPRELEPEFTERDIFCAAFIRDRGGHADQYSDRELLRICKIYRETNGAADLPRSAIEDRM